MVRDMANRLHASPDAAVYWNMVLMLLDDIERRIQLSEQP